MDVQLHHGRGKPTAQESKILGRVAQVTIGVTSPSMSETVGVQEITFLDTQSILDASDDLTFFRLETYPPIPRGGLCGFCITKSAHHLSGGTTLQQDRFLYSTEIGKGQNIPEIEVRYLRHVSL